MAGGEDLLIGIDSSTQSTTVGVWTARGRRVAGASAPLAVRTPRPGWAEQDPRLWWRSTRQALRDAVGQIDPAAVAAVGVAFQRETFTLADARGRFVRPGILWLDVRAGKQVERVASDLGRDAWHAATGKPLDITSAAARMLWLGEHEPDALDRCDRWVDVGAALARRLTGRWATCPAGADTSGLIGLESRDWLDDHAALGGLTRARLPELVGPGETIGPLTKAAARTTGLPAGVPVVAAGGDGHVFNVGVGASAAWRTSLTLGTSVVLGVASPRPLINPLFRTLLAASGRGYLLESVLQAGTYLLRWFVQQFGGDEAAWDRRAARVPPGCAGLVTLPNWWGLRFPEARPDVRGATVGWSNAHGPEHLYRSLLEGTSLELRRLLASYADALPRRPRGAIAAGGGGTRSRFWPQLLADATGRRVEMPRERDATALGAAVLAGVGAGVFATAARGCEAMCGVRRRLGPDRRRATLYACLYEEVYAPLLEQTAGLSEKLAALRCGQKDQAPPVGTGGAAPHG